MILISNDSNASNDSTGYVYVPAIAAIAHGGSTWTALLVVLPTAKLCIARKSKV